MRNLLAASMSDGAPTQSCFSGVGVQSYGILQRKRAARRRGLASMKFKETRPYDDPDVAALKIVELANSLEPYMDARLLVERINGAFLFELKGTPAEYKASIVRSRWAGS
jgi:hypothetical protein